MAGTHWMGWILVGSLLMVLASTAQSDEGDPPVRAKAGKDPAREQRLTWLRRNLPKLLPDDRERSEVLRGLEELSNPELEKVLTMCLDELEARRRRQLTAIKAANAQERARQEAAAERAFREQLAWRQSPPAYAYPAYGNWGAGNWGAGNWRGGYWGAGPVGYIPVITWLPDGVSLNTQAVVGPDGRHVRVSASPMFSTIGPVYTFNYVTGETRRYPPEGTR